MWDVRIVEVSDVTHTISYEIVETNPPLSYTSAIHTISLKKISDVN